MHINHSAVLDQDPVAAIALAALTLALFLCLRRTREGSRQGDGVAAGQVEATVRWPRRHAPAAAAARRGFTLAELMITVAIVAILAAIAIPTYRDHVRTSRRSEAQAFLMAVASRQQQFLMDTRAYAGTLSAMGIPTPTNVNAAYEIRFASPGGTPPTFQISAVPWAGTDQVREKCGTLTIDNTGAKTALLSRCW